MFQYKVAFKMENDISCAELTDSVFFCFSVGFSFLFFFLQLVAFFYANILLRLVIQSHCSATAHLFKLDV